MAGFEVVVRPVVFPNIRPAPPRILAPEDDPEQGFASLSGSGGRLIDLPRSYSWSATNSYHTEAWREYTIERVSGKDTSEKQQPMRSTRAAREGGSAGGNGSFIDVERMTKVLLRDANGRESTITFAVPPEVDNVERLSTGNIRYNE
jgi:hypothetical protein